MRVRPGRCLHVLLGVCLLASCVGRQAESARAELRSWAAGPVRWLLLPPERRAMTRVDNATEATVFRAAFWARRDEHGRSDGPGSFRAGFLQRVEAADRLYTGPRRGSLTDQGRALLLLGAPGGITVTTRLMLSLEAGTDGRRRRVRSPVEVWHWRPDQLSRRLLSRLEATARTDGVEIRFDMRRETAELIEGETLLQTAARALVVRAPAAWGE